jgi:hypothetical protein
VSILSDIMDRFSTYVLVGRDQYEVLLDDKDSPSRMWSPITFSMDSIVTIDGGKPRYRVIRGERDKWLGLCKYELEPVR